MSAYLDNIDEIAEAADKLSGDGYTPESRAIAIQCATQVWFQYESDRRQAEYLKRVEDAANATNGARQQFFGAPSPQG